MTSASSCLSCVSLSAVSTPPGSVAGVRWPVIRRADVDRWQSDAGPFLQTALRRYTQGHLCTLGGDGDGDGVGVGVGFVCESAGFLHLCHHRHRHGTSLPADIISWRPLSFLVRRSPRQERGGGLGETMQAHPKSAVFFIIILPTPDSRKEAGEKWMHHSRCLIPASTLFTGDTHGAGAGWGLRMSDTARLQRNVPFIHV